MSSPGQSAAQRGDEASGTYAGLQLRLLPGVMPWQWDIVEIGCPIGG